MPRESVRTHVAATTAAACDQEACAPLDDTEMRTLSEFCSRNRISKSLYYYIVALGRGPTITTIGARKLVSPEDEAAWRQSLKDNPLPDAVRPAAKAAMAKEAA